jgi:RNA polymerase sigma-70 factor (ECF subfamily)
VTNPEPLWLAQALKGDAEAFSQLVETYQRPVFNLCYRMLSDPDEAEDAAQETFMRAYNGLHRYDNQRSFSTWLLSIAAHYCIDQIRRRRMTIVSIDDDREGVPEIDLPDHTPGPEATFSQHEEQRRVQMLLKMLGPQDRAAVVMLYWYEMSYEDIANALGLTVSAVKSRLHRARLELAEHWNKTNSQALPVERRCHGEVHSPAL